MRDAKHLAERTIENYISVIRRLAVDVQKPTGEVTRIDLLRRQGRGIMPRSAQQERTAYRGFWEVITDEGLVRSNPAAKLPKVKARKGQPWPITSHQFAALFTAGHRGAYASSQEVLVLAGYIGMRAHEVAKTRGEMFNLVDNTVTYVTKGGYERTQPLHPVARALAERMPRRGWWFPSPNGTGPVLAKSISSLLGRRIRAAGIDDPRITGHSIRHMFATEMARAGPTLMAGHLHGMHAARGLTTLTAVASRIEEADGHLSVSLDDGRTGEGDIVVVGIGIVPNVELTQAAGIAVADGIIIDDQYLTSAPGVYAAGDVAVRTNADGSIARREEHWEAAQISGDHAAHAMLGRAVPDRGASWFWSDRHDVHLEAVGRLSGPGDMAVRRAGEHPAVFLLDGETLIGAAAIDDPMAIRTARRIIEQAIPVTADEFRDPAVSLRSLVRAGR